MAEEHPFVSETSGAPGETLGTPSRKTVSFTMFPLTSYKTLVAKHPLLTSTGSTDEGSTYALFVEIPRGSA